VDQPGRVRVPQIMEPQATGTLAGNLGDSLTLGPKDLRRLHTALVGPGRSVPLVVFLDDLAQQAGTDERRPPDPTPPSAPTQRPPDFVGEHFARTRHRISLHG